MSIKKVIFLIVGFIFLGLGCVGVVLPMLPAFPFLLVAGYCFARSSERVNEWFLSTNLYKKHLKTFVKGQGMTMNTKIKIMSMVTLVMVISFYMMRNTNAGRIAISIVWVFHMIYFIFFVKTIKSE